MLRRYCIEIDLCTGQSEGKTTTVVKQIYPGERYNVGIIEILISYDQYDII